jgi:hypothetical protein
MSTPLIESKMIGAVSGGLRGMYDAMMTPPATIRTSEETASWRTSPNFFGGGTAA